LLGGADQESVDDSQSLMHRLVITGQEKQRSSEKIHMYTLPLYVAGSNHPIVTVVPLDTLLAYCLLVICLQFPNIYRPHNPGLVTWGAGDDGK
jgi:hypothetical protein